jgi:hypothetical protein
MSVLCRTTATGCILTRLAIVREKSQERGLKGRWTACECTYCSECSTTAPTVYSFCKLPGVEVEQRSEHSLGNLWRRDEEGGFSGQS